MLTTINAINLSNLAAVRPSGIFDKEGGIQPHSRGRGPKRRQDKNLTNFWMLPAHPLGKPAIKQ
jgi:hypothetical protein